MTKVILSFGLAILAVAYCTTTAPFRISSDRTLSKISAAEMQQVMLSLCSDTVMKTKTKCNTIVSNDCTGSSEACNADTWSGSCVTKTCYFANSGGVNYPGKKPGPNTICPGTYTTGTCKEEGYTEGGQDKFRCVTDTSNPPEACPGQYNPIDNC